MPVASAPRRTLCTSLALAVPGGNAGPGCQMNHPTAPLSAHSRQRGSDHGRRPCLPDGPTATHRPRPGSAPFASAGNPRMLPPSTACRPSWPRAGRSPPRRWWPTGGRDGSRPAATSIACSAATAPTRWRPVKTAPTRWRPAKTAPSRAPTGSPTWRRTGSAPAADTAKWEKMYFPGMAPAQAGDGSGGGYRHVPGRQPRAPRAGWRPEPGSHAGVPDAARVGQNCRA